MSHLCNAELPINSEYFMVTARIIGGCALSNVSQELNFSPVMALSQERVAASIINNAQTWNIRCTANIPVTIQLDAGEHYADVRRMRHQSSDDYIPYRLYTDSSYSSEYPSGKSILVSTDPNTKQLDFAVYAIADLNNNLQSRPSGIYNDNVAITISW